MHMQMTEVLSQMGGLRSIARELGVTEKQVRSGAETLVPLILVGFRKQAQSETASPEDLSGLLGQLGGDDLLDNVLAPRPTNIRRGNGVLRHIFGSEDVSRAVAQVAAAHSGLEPSLLEKMLPMLAMLVVGYLAKQPGAGAAALASAQPGGLDRKPQGASLDDVLRTAATSMARPWPMRR
jgi:hypothetical protein